MEQFAPLEANVRLKDLTYVSTAKLQQLVLDSSKRGFNVTLPLGLGGGGVASDQMSVRALLGAAAELFAQNGILTYEATPRVGDWLLVRAIATCGSAWPWNGDRDEFHETAWWLARSERLRVLAYGHRTHLAGIGRVPNSPAPERVATWWPSIEGGYGELLSAVAGVVVSDSLDVTLEPSDDAALTFRGLENFFFNPGVERNDPLVKQGVFELMLRVDGVENDDEDLPIVYGSPLWVARETRPVSGTYTVADYPEERGVSARASWDGREWSDLRIEDNRDPRLSRRSTSAVLPEMPQGPPSQHDLVSLTIRQPPPVSLEAATLPESRPGRARWWKRLLDIGPRQQDHSPR